MAKLLSDNLRLKFEPGALSKQPRQEERISDPNLLWQPESIVLRRTCHLENPQAAIDPDLAEALLKDRKGEEISPTDGRARSLITSIMSTPSSSFKPPEPITTAASLSTASAPMANVITVPKATDESSKPTLVTATRNIGRNHLWDSYRATVNDPSDPVHPRQVILQLSVLQRFPRKCQIDRPAYCDRIERFSIAQAKKGVEREAWFYQKYAPLLNKVNNIVPNYIGTFHCKHPCREDSPTRIDLYAMILDEPGELLGSAWQDIHCPSISGNIWRKVYELYDFLHSHQIIHNTELVALNIFYDKKTGKVRIANFFDALVLASDNCEPGERAELKAQRFLRHEKARIALGRRIID
ncbi:hypothetical protein I203_102251 [Kwoniella mangroviensis CBS 8507]|uniref:uncharacterized protein n=1 Tax=Kwoniella mangroviensis CBS 8507 TaxID=1296122 RepID=UPI00080D4C85|nr:uncharacterized protein I203_03448 [Kwoniella mangroviensis CBS 8507]OCF67750.1 hypothetical protein I203_03448 [Kwoniella mangroviensis CBS 8507]